VTQLGRKTALAYSQEVTAVFEAALLAPTGSGVAPGASLGFGARESPAAPRGR
jgi:hypothetical protein